jgi:protein required for attachment to host cells
VGKVTVPQGFDTQFVKHWYLVANRVDAIIYEGKLDGEFHYVKRFRNPKGKLTELQLVADRPGRTFSSSRTGTRHGYEPRSHYHEEVAMKFARRIAKELEKAAVKGEYSDLIVMAEPHFLGMINKELPKNVKSVLRKEVPREWSQGSDQELKEYLQAKLA